MRPLRFTLYLLQDQMSRADSPQRVVGQIYTFRCVSQRQPSDHLNISSLASPLDNRPGGSASPKRQCTSGSGQEENYWLASHTTRWSESSLRYDTIWGNMLRRTAVVRRSSSCRRLIRIQWVLECRLICAEKIRVNWSVQKTLILTGS
jgi:hypothetical protein